MHTKMFRLLALGLAAFLVGCSSPTSSDSKPVAVPTPTATPSTTPTPTATPAATPSASPKPSASPTPAPVVVAAPTTLFLDSNLTYAVTPTTQKLMVQDMGNAASSASTALVSPIPGTGTFQAYPQYWDGGIAWAIQPTGTVGFYNLSGVKTIQFKIKSSTILPTQLALFLQWGSATTGNGNEYTIPLKYSSSVTDGAGTTSDLGVNSIADWTTVTFNLASLPDGSTFTGEPTRYGYTAEHFFAANSGDGATHVTTPFAIKWYGSSDGSSNTGPLAAGASYQIGDIQFLDASGANVAIATGVTYPAPVSNPTALDSTAEPTTGIVNLLDAAGTNANPSFLDWSQAVDQNWYFTAVKVNDDTASVAGKTLKTFTFLSTSNFTGSQLAAPVTIAGTSKLHISVFTPNGGPSLPVKIDLSTKSAGVSVPPTSGTIVQGQWSELEYDFSSYTNTSIDQILFDSTGSAGTYWIDNIYFHN